MPPKSKIKKLPIKRIAKSTSQSKTELKIISNIDVSSITKPEPKNPPAFPIDAKNNNVRYWLIKSEPLSRIDPKTNKDVAFPFSELLKTKFEEWNGVRNHEAKNNMLNMKKNDILLFYHSNTPNPGIVGLAKVANEAHPDSLQFDTSSNYYDPKSSQDSPRWWCVDVSFLRRFRSKVTLQELRDNDNFKEMFLVKRGRLSVTPVRKEEFNDILDLEAKKPISDDIDCEIEEKFIKISK